MRRDPSNKKIIKKLKNVQLHSLKLDAVYKLQNLLKKNFIMKCKTFLIFKIFFVTFKK